MDKIVETKNLKNKEIVEILEKYNHYGHMNWEDLKKFRAYRDELRKNTDKTNKNILKKYAGFTDDMFKPLEKELEEIEYINEYKIYTTTLTSLYEMNAILFGLWNKEFSGYGNNAFFDFQKLVKMVNAYWQIEKPYKPANKIAYGWKFSMDKAEGKQGYFSKSWKLYMWGCIKNYLIRNGIEFTKEESLKVRKIVGLVNVKDTIE